MTTAPYCQYGVLDAAGRLKKKVPVAIPKPVMMHDMAISDKYALFLDLPLEFEPEKMVKLKRIPFFFNQRPSR